MKGTNMITWTIQNMVRELNNGFVINVSWSCTAQQDSASAFYGGTTTYVNNPDEPGFIPYDQLTEEIVLGWVYAGLGDQKAEIEATLTAKVQKQLNPTTANGMPWA
jgi:hypothetical protein